MRGVFGQRGHDQRQPQDPQQQLLGIRVRHQPAHVVAPAVRRDERAAERGDRDRHAEEGMRPGAALGKDRQQRQVGGHREILEHQDRQHGRCFAVAEPAQVVQQARDHTGRRDVGDTGQGQDADAVEAEQPARRAHPAWR